MTWRRERLVVWTMMRKPEDDGFLAALSGAAEDWTTEKKVENDEEETADI